MARRRIKKRVVFLRFVRSLISVVILSSLILGITLIVRQAESLTPKKVSQAVSPVLAKLRINVSEEEVGKMAETLAYKISQTNLSSGQPGSDVMDNDSVSIFASDDKKEEIFKVAIFADIQQDFGNLEKALKLVEENNYSKVFILGDFTDYGDVEALEAVKNLIDTYNFDYWAIPGDHDIAASLDAGNFIEVYGSNYHLVEIEGYTFLFFDNSPNYTPVELSLVSWFQDNIGKADFIIISQPLYVEGLNPPFSNIYMGSMQIEPESEELKERQDIVKDQGRFILNLIRAESDTKAIFAGDHHKSSKLSDPTREGLAHYTVGAISSTVREYPQSLIQTSRFTELTVYKGGSYFVRDIVLD